MHRLYAAKSEALAKPAQRDLFLNEAEALAPQGAPMTKETTPEVLEVAAHHHKKLGRKPLDPHLPCEIDLHELAEVERACTHDVALLVEIGAEISEQLDIVPQQVRVIQHHRIKYACPYCDDSIRVGSHLCLRGYHSQRLADQRHSPGSSPPNTRMVCRCIGKPHYSAALVAICRAPPWYASLMHVGQAMQPIINLLRNHLLEADLILSDETVVQLPKESGRAAQTKSYLWVQMTGSGPPIRLFVYTPGRAGQHAQPLYDGIKPGVALMSDGYEVYNAIAAVPFTRAVGHTHAAILSKPKQLSLKLRANRNHWPSSLLRPSVNCMLLKPGRKT